MAETVKTQAALLAQMADGGDNTAEEVRDNIVSMYPRRSVQDAIATAGWSWVNQGSATLETVNGALVFNKPSTGAADLTAYVRTAPSTPYTITVRMAGLSLATDGSWGLCFRESSTGKFTVFVSRRRVGQEISIENWTDATTFSASVGTLDTIVQSERYFRLDDDGTNLEFYHGIDGSDGGLMSITTVGRTSFMAGGPDQVGFVVRDNSATIAAIGRDWVEA